MCVLFVFSSRVHKNSVMGEMDFSSFFFFGAEKRTKASSAMILVCCVVYIILYSFFAAAAARCSVLADVFVFFPFIRFAKQQNDERLGMVSFAQRETERDGEDRVLAKIV